MDGDTEQMIKAISDHKGISFTSSRSIGSFEANGDSDERASKYTLISSADEEEDKAI